MAPSVKQRFCDAAAEILKQTDENMHISRIRQKVIDTAKMKNRATRTLTDVSHTQGSAFLSTDKRFVMHRGHNLKVNLWAFKGD